MDAATVIAAVKAKEAELKAANVAHVYLFGSVARGEAGPDSDVDLMFEEGKERFGLLDYAGLKRLANELLPFDVDFVHYGSLRGRMKPLVDRDKIPIF